MTKPRTALAFCGRIGELRSDHALSPVSTTPLQALGPGSGSGIHKLWLALALWHATGTFAQIDNDQPAHSSLADEGKCPSAFPVHACWDLARLRVVHLEAMQAQ